MKRKPSRPFVYLALLMVLLLVIGLIVVGRLLSIANTYAGEQSLYMTVSAIQATNSLVANNIAQTQTASRAHIPNTTDMSPVIDGTVLLGTPIPSMSPTAEP